ncbi:MAG: NAD(P)-binding domain-containing protein, partial [Pseudomonadota bacterium]
MTTIAILMPGDMGHGVGQALIAEGHRVISCLAGRSEHTRGLAARAGIEDTGDLAATVTQADVILSILPPDRALPLALDVAAALAPTQARPVYVDCNAVSPTTAEKVAAA